VCKNAQRCGTYPFTICLVIAPLKTTGKPIEGNTPPRGWIRARLRHVSLAAFLSAQFLLPAFGAVPATPDALNQLYAQYWEEYLRANPMLATFHGDKRYNNRFGALTSDADRKNTKRLAQTYLARSAKFDPAPLPPEDRISYDLFRYRQQLALDGLQFPSHLIPVNPVSSLPLVFAQLGSGRLVQPFDTVKDYDNWLARARGFPKAVDGMIADMKKGITQGVVMPRVLVKPVLAQLESLGSANLEANHYMAPVKKFPQSFSAADKARLTAAFTVLVRDQLVPAYQRLLVFMRDRYLPAARDTIALGALPGGSAWYAFQVRSATTTDLSPKDIHTIGLREVARIRGLLESAKYDVKFKGSMEEFFVFLNTAPELRFTSRQDMQAAYEGLRLRVDAKIPAFFGHTPKTAFEIRPVESFRESAASPAQYVPGLPDGSRPGIFYYNAYQPETRTRFTTTVFYVHEAIPGHHFEISLAQEREGLPAFRRFGSTLAYSEGWGLYSEMLGQEMGLYDDPWQVIGRLSTEVWRAARLVIDTGIHTQGWSREQAIRYFLDNVPQSTEVATQEVDRYIAMPGQALSYKIGELKIRELRARAEQALGAKFNLRDFHGEILSHGSVPLGVLEAAMDRWLAAQ
jgi:uncharacterized protein (DUF885 family)